MSAPGEFTGMTTNERLFVAGLLPTFDAASASGDRAALARILGRVGLADEADLLVATAIERGRSTPPE